VYASFKSPVVFAGDYVPGTGCTQRGDSADTTIIDFGGSASDVKLTQLIASPYALIKFDRLTAEMKSPVVRTAAFRSNHATLSLRRCGRVDALDVSFENQHSIHL
jgi:hypothetical protein